MTTITLTATITSNIIKGGGAQIPPSNLTPPLISGSAVVGQTLSVSDGTWAGSPAPTFSYQWKRDGVDIVGATSNTYILDQNDATKVITCVVTATNLAGSANATSSNSLTILDADASAFITAASITNPTQITAINVLTNDLKGYNIWSKMKAIYPFVGGTASTHKWNLKDPRDLDAAFRLVFNGGWTHSSTGALPNGTNAYADTKLIPSTNQINNNYHIAYYSRTQDITGDKIDFGTLDTNTITQINLSLYFQSVGKTFVAGNYPTNTIISTNTNTLGLLINSRTANNSAKMYFNNNILGTLTSTYTGNLTNLSYFIAARHNASQGIAVSFSNRQCAFATIGDGLTDTDATNLSWITEQYQTTLGRSVNPWYNNGNLLLDNYPNAAVAYSVRKLRNYYIGAAIRVRRSSDNAEQDIYFDSTGNLDTASLLSFVGAGNGFVTTWYDQSGNGNNVIQATAINQTRIVTSGSILLRGSKPSIDFGGVNDELSFNITTSILQNSFLNIYNVMTIDNYDSNGTAYFGTTVNTTAWQHGTSAIHIQQGLSANISSIATNNSLQYLYVDYPTSIGKRIAINNVLYTASAVTPSIASGSDTFVLGTWEGGTAWTLDGAIQEFIIYTNDQSLNRYNIQSNINSYYNLWSINSSSNRWDGSQTGILNTYSGASAAYSIRALNSNYTGPLIKVRRSSDNAETDIYALQNGELDTSYLLSFTGANNAFVVSWYDQSGNGRDISQNILTNQPIIVNSGSLVLVNTKPCISFDGINDSIGNYFGNIISQSITTFNVATYPSKDSNSRYFWDTGNIGSGNRTVLAREPNYLRLFSGTSLDLQESSYTFNTGQQYLISTLSNSINSFISINSNIQLTGNSGTNGIEALTVGAGYISPRFANINYQELIIYPSNQTLNKTAIETNINSYYNIYP